MHPENTIKRLGVKSLILLPPTFSLKKLPVSNGQDVAR